MARWYVQLCVGLVSFASFFSHVAVTGERVINFNAALTMRSDGVITLVETIEILALGNYIKRGIMREIPTHYGNQWGMQATIPVTIQSVLLDGKTCGYRIEELTNGIRLVIGEPKEFLAHGMHTYTISYVMTRSQISYFADHDELYWNVTGHGWRLPIERASFQATFPFAVPAESWTYVGYTGYQGSTDQDCIITCHAENTIVGYTTKPLKCHQGFTVALGWPKGYTPELSLFTTLYYACYDNAPWILLALICAGLVLMYGSVWMCNSLRMSAETIIPLFYPPEELSPAEVACINAMKVDAKMTVASLVNLAVKGFVHIKHHSGVVRNGGLVPAYYTLHKKKNSKFDQLPWHEKVFMKKLFPTKESVECTISSDNAQWISAINAWHVQALLLKAQLIDDKDEIVAIGAISAIVCSLMLFVVCMYSSSFHWFYEQGSGLLAMIVGLVAINVWGAWLIKTHRRLELYRKVQGYKLFMQTTKRDERILGEASPELTPELYEEGLPYALALGLEETWTKKFQSVFDNMNENGVVYSPGWCNLGYHGHFSWSSLSTLTQNALPSAVTASSSRPGTTSGFGGGGRSGGGFGGGGGGGW